MVKRTVESYECDVCGEEGERYVVIYPEGSLALDRCMSHASVLLNLKNEKGQWTKPKPARAGFKISTPQEIEEKRLK